MRLVNLLASISAPSLTERGISRLWHTSPHKPSINRRAESIKRASTRLCRHPTIRRRNVLGYPVAAFDREFAVEPYILVIACLVGGLVVWGLLRVGAKRPTAGWAWVLVLLFFGALA